MGRGRKVVKGEAGDRTGAAKGRSPSRSSIPTQVGIYLAICLLLIGAWVGEAWGQTELSGAIWGDLVREGNPHIVVDSCWVPEGDTLILREGVELRFQEGLGLDVYGNFCIKGSADERVTLMSNQEGQHWRGIRVFARDSTIVRYASIMNSLITFELCSFSILLVDSSQILSDSVGIGPLLGDGLQNIWRIYISGSHWESKRGVSIDRGRIWIKDSYIAFVNGWGSGFQGIASWFDFENSTIVGNARSDEFGSPSHFRNCTFLRPDVQNIAEVFVYGNGASIVDCRVEGYIRLMGIADRDQVSCINNVVKESIVGRFQNGVIRNCVAGNIRIRGEESIIVDSCIVLQDFFVSDCKDLLVSNNIFCVLDSNGADHGGSISMGGSHRDSSDATIFRNLVWGRLDIHDWTSFQMDHNAFIAGVSPLGEPLIDLICRMNNRVYHKFENNIFESASDSIALFSISDDDRYPVFRYNSVNGFSRLNQYYETPLEYLDSSNVFADAQLIRNDSTYILSADSPCIDAGDPNAERDPDGTRSDIGVFAIFQDAHSVGEHSTIQSRFSLYPNPATTHLIFNLSTYTKRIENIYVFNILGQQYISYRINEPTTSAITLNIRDLPTGRYFVVIEYAGGRDYYPFLHLR